jgi:hypothetical protein
VPPNDTAVPFNVIEELAKLVLEMTPAPVSDANEAAPLREREVPCPLVKKMFLNVEEAAVELAL